MQREARGPEGRPFVIDDALLAPHRGVLETPTAPARLVYAATHLVMRPEYAASTHEPDRPGRPEEIAEAIDWEATLDLRRRLDRFGFGIAEAMDTAQRFEIGWPVAERLIRECGALGLANGFIGGAAADHLPRVGSEDELVDGVLEQASVIREAGGLVIVLPLLWLARSGADEEAYVRTYARLVEGMPGPLFVHWLGEAFHPELGNYFPGDSFERVMALDPAKVRGAKLSLLDPAREIEIRARLLERDQIVLTGDDFHFAGLLRGGSATTSTTPAAVERTSTIGPYSVPLGDFSHGLLGAFDAVAEPAGIALAYLARGDVERYTELMAPCEELARWLFRKPTQHYKAGLAFLAWLNGAQDNRMLVNRQERKRSRDELLETARLAARAGVLADAELAAARLHELS